MNEALSLVQNAYAAFGSGDIPALLQLLSEDVEWQFTGDAGAPYTGTVRGRAQVGDWFGTVVANDDIQAFAPREFLAGPDHVTVLGHERAIARRGGGTFETDWVHVWHVRDARLSRFFGIFDTEAAARARRGG